MARQYRPWLLVVTCVAMRACVLAVGAAPASRPATQPASAPAPVLTVATYNVNYGLRGKEALDAVVETLRKTGADVVGIQEGNQEIYAHLQRSLGGQYPHILSFPSRQLAGQFAWLSRRELFRPRVVQAEHGAFDAHLVDVRVGGRRVTLANVHLYPTGVDPEAGWGAALDEFVRTEDLRLKEIKLIVSRLPEGPVILLGDLNSLPSFTATRYLASQKLIDSFGSVNPDKPQQPTWEWQTRKGKWRLRLDYIYHSNDFRTLESRVIEAGPSDHFPVVSRLELLPPAPRAEKK